MPFTEYTDNLDGTVTVKDAQGRDILLPMNNPDVQAMLTAYYTPTNTQSTSTAVGASDKPVSSTDNTLFTKPEEIVRRNPYDDPNGLQQLDRNGEYSLTPTSADDRRYIGQTATKTNVPTQLEQTIQGQLSGTIPVKASEDSPRIDTSNPWNSRLVIDTAGQKTTPQQAIPSVAPNASQLSGGYGAIPASAMMTSEDMSKQTLATQPESATTVSVGNPYAQQPQQPQQTRVSSGFMTKGGWTPTGASEQLTVYDPKLLANLNKAQEAVDVVEVKNAKDRGMTSEWASEARADAQEKHFIASANLKDWEHRNKWLLDEEDSQLQKNREALEQMRIDPNKFWVDQSVPARIGLVLAAGLAQMGNAYMAVGKVGSGNAPNPVIAMIDKAIDRNIDAQKADIMNAKGNYDARQKEFLKHYNLFQDERQYREAVKAKILTDAEENIKREVMNTEDEVAKRKADNALAYLQLERTKAELEATKVTRTQASRYQAPTFVGGSATPSTASNVANLSPKEQKEFEKLNEELAKRGLNDSQHYALNLKRAALEAKARGDSSVPGYGFGADLAETLPAAIGKRVISKDGVQNQQSGRIIARQTAKANNSGALSDKDVSDTAAALWGDGSPDAVLYGLEQSQRTKQTQLNNILGSASSPAVRELLRKQYGATAPQSGAPTAPLSTYKPKQ
jgi:hypothetical protein